MENLINKIEIHRLSIPLKRPFRTALRTATSSDEIVLKLEDSSGKIGWGSACPITSVSGETIEGVILDLENQLTSNFLGLTANRAFEIVEDIQSKNTIHNQKSRIARSALNAIDTALCDLAARQNQVSLSNFLSNSTWKSFETDITISTGTIEEMISETKSALDAGYDRLKIKVGKDPAADLERVVSIGKILPPHVRLRIDANQGWNTSEAVEIISQISKNPAIEFIEQPVKKEDVQGLALVRKQSKIPIAADESVFDMKNLMEVLRLDAADIINIKLNKAGGLRPALSQIVEAEKHGRRILISCMIESKIGLTAATALASCCKEPPFIDLDAANLLKFDPVSGGIVCDGKYLIPPDSLDGSGITAVDNMTLLRKLEA